MKKFRVEIVCGLALLLAFIGISVFQSASRLTRAEVDAYITRIEQAAPPDIEGRSELISRLRAWGENDDGRPVYMLNLMRFHDRLKPLTGAPTTGTPREVNAQYEDKAIPMLLARGAYPLMGGETSRIRPGQAASNLVTFDPVKDNWDRVLVIRYPGRRSFLDLITDPAYLKVMPYKLAALEVVLTPVTAELVIPDLRWLVGGGGLIIFLLIAWWQAQRRLATAREGKSDKHLASR